MKKVIKKATALLLVAIMAFTPVMVNAEEVQEPFAATTQLALEQAAILMDALSVAGMTIAIVDIGSDFVWLQGLGYANAATQEPVTEYTLFSIGSTAKVFTAVAIMQLVEQGLLCLDEPITTYLPNFSVLPNPAWGGDYRNVTTRMLLTHTSGMHELLGVGASIEGQDRNFYNEMLPILANMHMQNVEMDRMTYNNTGYALLGLIVAAFEGNANYFDGFVNFTQENIFAPAGMTSSSFDVNSINRANLALSYADANTPLGVHQYSNAPSTGGMVSNAYDMARFMHIILSDGGNLLNQQTIQEMITVQDMGIRFPTQYDLGLGFMEMHHPDGIITTGHGGNLLHHTEFLLCFDSGIGVYVSTNSMSGAGAVASLANLMLRVAVEEKTGTPIQPTPFNITNPVTNVQQLVGWYQFMGAGSIQLVLCDEGLLHFMELMGLPPITLVPAGDGTFDSMIGNVWFKNVDGYIFFMGGSAVLSERVVPTAPINAEWLIGTVYFTIDGVDIPIGWTSFTDDGILYYTDGSRVHLWEQVDHYTFFTLGRGREFGTVVEYSIENGVIVGRESGITFTIQPHTFIDEPETPVTNETPARETSVPSLPLG